MDTISESQIRTEEFAKGIARGQFAGVKCACGYFGEAVMIIDKEETINGVKHVYSHSGCPNCDVSKPPVG